MDVILREAIQYHSLWQGQQSGHRCSVPEHTEVLRAPKGLCQCIGTLVVPNPGPVRQSSPAAWGFPCFHSSCSSCHSSAFSQLLINSLYSPNQTATAQPVLPCTSPGRAAPRAAPRSPCQLRCRQSCCQGTAGTFSVSPVPWSSAQTRAGDTLLPLQLQVWGMAQTPAAAPRVSLRKGSTWEHLWSRTGVGCAHTSQPLLPGPGAKGSEANAVQAAERWCCGQRGGQGQLGRNGAKIQPVERVLSLAARRHNPKSHMCHAPAVWVARDWCNTGRAVTLRGCGQAGIGPC